MTVKEALTATEQCLNAAEIISYRFEAKELVAFALETTTEQLWLKKEDRLTEDKVNHLNTLVTRRLGGEPLQYILGSWEFYSLPFKVGPGVLIPRGDTELLVDAALKFLNGKENPKALDLCSGSGCIAIAVAKNRPDCSVKAIELSSEALNYLKFNSELNKTDLDIVQADITEYNCEEKFDIILSNPPYIETETIKTLDAEVLNEPHMALDGGNDGLDFYRIIAKKWSKNLKPGGALMVEIGINQHNSVSEIFRSAGLENIQQLKDINEIERVIVGTLPCRTS